MKMNSQNKLYRTILFFTLLFAANTLFTVSPVNAQSPADKEKQDEKKQSPQANVELTLNKPIERELAGNEAHSYKIVLAADQYLHVVVEQKGIDVIIALFAPDGEKVAEIDSPNGTQGEEPIFFVAETAGNYHLEVRSPEPDVEAGRYQVKIEELRVATKQDKSRIAASQAIFEAEQMSAQRKEESLYSAIKKYEEALIHLRAAGDRKLEASILDEIGVIYDTLGDQQKALDYFNQSLELYKLIGDRSGQARAIYDIALAQNDDEAGKQKGLEYLQQSFLLNQAEGNYSESATVLTTIGYVYEGLGELKKALDYYQQALPLRKVAGDSSREATTLNNLGSVYNRLGEKQKALDYLFKSLPLLQAADDPRREAATLNNIAGVYADLGENVKALDFYNQALTLIRSAEERRGEARTLGNIGLVYNNQGETRKALDYFNQALKIKREINDRAGEATTVKNIGDAYNNLGEFQKALGYFTQALSLFKVVGNRRGEAYAYGSIGSVNISLNEKQKALDSLNQSIQIFRVIGDRDGEIETLSNLARYEKLYGNLEDSLSRIESALLIIESLRTKISGQELRSSYFATTQNYYEFYIDILMQMHKQQPTKGYDAKALQASERARARSLLESLAEANTDIRQGVDPKLLERERELQQLIAGKSERLTRISNDEKLKEQKAAAEKEVSDLLAQYQEVEAQIRLKSPRYAALTQPVPADLAEIQKLLDKDTVLLEYSLGEERSYLWLVTSQSLKSYELPKRARIEELADQFVAGVTGQNNVPKSDKAAYQKRQIFVKKATADYPQVSAELGKILLGQIAPEIKDKRLLIVGDGILQYVPFAALPFADSKLQIANSKSNAKSGVKYLVETNEIVNLPSASTLAILRREQNERGVREYSKTVAVFADPVFDENDRRVADKNEKTSDKTVAKEEQKTDAKNLVLRSANDVGLENRGGLKRLTESAREAEAIRDTAAKGQTTLALGFDASRERVLAGNFGDYRIVHFATHGFLNEEHPELSGVVLSLIDEQGKPQNGFLRLNDIYNLKLPVEMVVLSACQTGVGKNVRGEGLIGLTRGFMYAGAPRVVATLWSVDDFATKELMRIFYQKMLRENLSPAAALRAAQNEIRGRKEWKSPMFWAGFVLQGEWQK